MHFIKQKNPAKIFGDYLKTKKNKAEKNIFSWPYFLFYLNKLETKIKNGTDIAKIIAKTKTKHSVDVKNFLLFCFI